MFSASLDTFIAYCSAELGVHESHFEDIATYYWQEIGYVPTQNDFNLNNGRNLRDEYMWRNNAAFRTEQQQILLGSGNPQS